MKKNIFIIGSIVITFLITIVVCIYYFSERVLISINGSDVVQLKLNDIYDDMGANAKVCHMSECRDISSDIVYKIDLDNSRLGEYELIYEITYNEKTYTDKRIVNVVDTEKPIITLNDTNAMVLCPDESYYEVGFVAHDNYDGDITDKVNVEIFDDLVIYSVEDSSGNKAEVRKNIERNDTTKPVIELKGSTTVKIKLNEEYEDSGFSVTDDCDQIDISKVIVNSNVDTTKEGTYNVSYSVSDISGNVATANRTVIVQKPVSFDTVNKDEYLDSLEKYIKEKDYNVSIGYVNLETGYTYLYRNNVVYYGASLVKTVDALYVYEKMNFDENTRLKVEKAISVSDNAAHRQLVDLIGIENLRQYGRSMGASNFLTRSNSDYFGNTTVNDQIAVWKYLYNFINTNSKGNELKQYFINSYCNNLLFDGIPTTMHKYGYYGDYFHNVGIVYSDSPYLVVILTKHGNNNYKSVIKDLSQKIYDLNKIDN